MGVRVYWTGSEWKKLARGYLLRVGGGDIGFDGYVREFKEVMKSVLPPDRWRPTPLNCKSEVERFKDFLKIAKADLGRDVSEARLEAPKDKPEPRPTVEAPKATIERCVDLGSVSTDDLLAELKRRLRNVFSME